MKIDMEEIARLAEVTRPTVSYVLNNKWKEKRISREVRDKILKLAKDLDYHPNIVARGLATNRTQNIGVAVHSIEYLTAMYFGTILQGIAHQVGLHDYNMQFEVTDSIGDSAKNLYFLKKAKENCVDGIIIIDQDVPDLEIIKLKNMNIPFVLVDRNFKKKDAYCIRVDNKKGICVATENLIENGHKRIVFFSEPMKQCKIIDMFEGYCEALKEYGIPVDERLIIDLGRENVDNNLSTWVENISRTDPPPTAIVCSSDHLAIRILKVLKEMEIRVPQDVALIGYNDDPNFAHVEPHLTTVGVPLREMGEESARMLFGLINGEEMGKKEVVLEPTFIERQSTREYVFDKVVRRENLEEKSDIQNLVPGQI